MHRAPRILIALTVLAIIVGLTPGMVAAGGTFGDDDGSIFEKDIDWLAAAGITKGCNPPTNTRYCPNSYVTRGQMAAFLVRALDYNGGNGSDRFTDDDGSIFEADINKLAAAGVTKGCNPPTSTRFCPNSYVTRGQMAAFLHRALSDDDLPPDPSPPPTAWDVEAYLRSLTRWSTLFPPEPNTEGPTGREDVVSEEVANTTYSCTEKEYSLTQTPSEIVTLDPNPGVMWPGALLVGTGFERGIGSMAELPIRQRAPLAVYSNELGGRTVVTDPTGSSASNAIVGIVAKADASGMPPSGSIHFEESETHSVQASALKVGLSAKYMGASVRSSLEVDRTATEHTVTAYFVERAFTMTADSPQTPGGWFSGDLTEADMKAQEALGRIGPENPPVYVASVTYGRILVFSVTADSSAKEITTQLRTRFQYGAFTGEADFESDYAKLMSHAKLRVTTIGGDQSDAEALIRSGDIGEYFTTPNDWSSYRPISYVIKNVRDDIIAAVSETTEYTITECTPSDVGDRVKITLDRIYINSDCDGGFRGNGDIYGTLTMHDRQPQGGTVGSVVFSKPANDYQELTTGGIYWFELGNKGVTGSEPDADRKYSVFEDFLSYDRTDLEFITGTLKDDDDTSHETLWRGPILIERDERNAPIYGEDSLYDNPGSGCAATVYWRVEKESDITGTIPTSNCATVRFKDLDYGGERVTLRNMGPVTMDMAGCFLHDTGEVHTYHFPGSFTLAPLAEVVLHSGFGTDTATDLYWEASVDVWADDGDRATLRDTLGAVVDRVEWKHSGDVPR